MPQRPSLRGGILYMIYTWDEGVQHWRTMTFNTGTQFRNENIFSIFQTVASVYKQKFHWYRHFESNLDCVEYYFQWKAPFWQRKGIWWDLMEQVHTLELFFSERYLDKRVCWLIYNSNICFVLIKSKLIDLCTNEIL